MIKFSKKNYFIQFFSVSPLKSILKPQRGSFYVDAARREFYSSQSASTSGASTLGASAASISQPSVSTAATKGSKSRKRPFSKVDSDGKF